MKRSVLFSIIFFSTFSLYAQNNPDDLLLGFFQSWDRENNSVVVMAAYQQLQLRVDGVNEKKLQECLIGDLIEFGVYQDESGLVMTSILNYGMPLSQEELEKVIAGYNKRRNEIVNRQ